MEGHVDFSSGEFHSVCYSFSLLFPFSYQLFFMPEFPSSSIPKTNPSKTAISKEPEDYCHHHHHHHHNHQSIGVSITFISCNLPFPSRYSNLVAVVVLGGSCLNSIPSLDLEFEFGSESPTDFSLKEVAASGSDDSRVGIAGTGGAVAVVV